MHYIVKEAVSLLYTPLSFEKGFSPFAQPSPPPSLTSVQILLEGRNNCDIYVLVETNCESS